MTLLKCLTHHKVERSRYDAERICGHKWELKALACKLIKVSSHSGGHVLSDNVYTLGVAYQTLVIPLINLLRVVFKRATANRGSNWLSFWNRRSKAQRLINQLTDKKTCSESKSQLELKSSNCDKHEASIAVYSRLLLVRVHVTISRG